MKEVTIKTYTIDELSEKAKTKAREWWMSAGFSSDDAWEQIKEDALNVGLKIICLRPTGIQGNNEGHFEKFAEDTAERIIKEHGKSCETYKTVTSYLVSLKELKRDEDGELYMQEQDKAEEIEKDFLYNLLEDYRIILEKEIEYQESDENVDEVLRANEYAFDENGKRVTYGGN
jgi:hypothetical protein